MEVADSIEEIKTICTYCSRKSIINMKHLNGVVITYGDDSPDLGCEEKYLPTCWKCWHKLSVNQKAKEDDESDDYEKYSSDPDWILSPHKSKDDK